MPRASKKSKGKRMRLFKRIFISTILIFSILVLPIELSEAKLNDSSNMPDLTAKSAAIYCNTTGEMVAQKNGDARANPYSITKLLTALIIIENHDLDDMVKVSKKASEQEGSSMELKEGEVVSVEELLYGLLILSGNDAAYALAEYDSDIHTFADKMNKKARKLGCTNTNFANPNGLKNKAHYTTANDFIKIANASLDNKLIKKITGTQEYEMRKTNKQEERTFETHLDQLKDENSGVISGKTGYWEDDDCTIALRFNKNNMVLTVVLLGDKKSERKNDENKAFSFAESAVKSVKALKEDQPVKKVWIKNGEHTRVQLYSRDDSIVYPKSGKKSSTKTKVALDKDIEAPLNSGDVVGKVKIYSDGKYMESVPLYVKDNIKEGWLPSMFYISNLGTICILISIILIINIIIIFKSNRKKQKIKNRHRK